MNTNIDLQNNRFLEFLLAGNDSASEFLRLATIRYTLPELDPIFSVYRRNDSFLDQDGKREVMLDYIIKNRDKSQNAIEFQVAKYREKEALRFQALGFLLLKKEEQRLGAFELANTVYQIIFLTNKPPKAHLLINHFRMRSPEGFTSPYNDDIPVRVYITLPLAIDKVNEQGLENLNEFEQFCYVLATGIVDPILKETNKMVQMLMMKYDQMIGKQTFLPTDCGGCL